LLRKKNGWQLKQDPHNGRPLANRQTLIYVRFMTLYVPGRRLWIGKQNTRPRDADLWLGRSAFPGHGKALCSAVLPGDIWPLIFSIHKCPASVALQARKCKVVFYDLGTESSCLCANGHLGGAALAFLC
jgi:hypothetical protein